MLLKAYGEIRPWNNNPEAIYSFTKAIGILLIWFGLYNTSEFKAHAQNIEGISKYDTSLMKLHSPAKASFYSAVLPGLGQAYNKKYWKMPILYAGIGGLVYAIKIHNDYYLRYKKAYILRIANDPNNKGGFPQYLPEQLLGAMDQRRRWRDLCVLSLAGVYLANIIDATVDAYLFDYDVSQDLSLHIEPAVFQTPSSTTLGLSCKFTF